MEKLQLAAYAYLVFDGGDGAAEEALDERRWKHEVPSSTSHV